MHRFPPLRLGDVTLRVPLADDTANLLAAVMLEPDGERCAQLERQLSIDASLALWALLCTEAHTGARPTSLGELASSVVKYVRPTFAETLDSPAIHNDLDVGRARRAAVRSAAIAAFCQDNPSARPGQALPALLHNAREWIALSVESVEQADRAVEAWQAALSGDMSHPAIEQALASYESIDASGPPPSVKLALADAERLWRDGRRVQMPLTKLARLATDLHQQVEQEKLAALAELAAGAGHEMNNPLAVISGRAQLLLQSETSPDRRLDLATIHAQAQRVHEMIAGLMLYADPPAPQLQRLDVSTVVADVADRFADMAIAAPVRLTLHLDDEPQMALADESQLRVALLALLENAAAASAGDDAIVTVSVQRQMLATYFAIRISVHNDGPEIAADVRQHLYEPFFSGRSAGRGLGVGLSKCWRIVAGHGGTMTCQSSDECGTSFSIVLPAAD